MTYTIYIKSGSSGWFSHDGCDMGISVVEKAEIIPGTGEYIELKEESEKYISRFLVTEVKHSIYDHGNYCSVYVIRA